jgi:vacuolar-type H+-ATPase subunit F/Vma7
MFDRVAIIGDKDVVFAFRALGVKVFSPENVEEARSFLRGLESEHIALCFVHESLLESLIEEREELGKKLCPVVVGYSDHRRITDHLGKMMRAMAIKATGSDSLVKKRGEDGAR